MPHTPPKPDENHEADLTYGTPRWLRPVTRLFGVVVMTGGCLILLANRDALGAIVVLVGCQIAWRPDQTHTWLDKLIDRFAGGGPAP